MSVIPMTASTVERSSGDMLEDAGVDLCVLNTLLAAADNFVDEIRRFVMPGGVLSDDNLFEHAKHAQTLISEAQDRAERASGLIDEAAATAGKGAA